MHLLYKIADDFEATIRILTEAEGGRKTAPYNGIRWDFSYVTDDSSDELYMIWPDFYGPDGASLPTDTPLPLGVDITARMFVVSDEMREQIHRARIKPEVKFYCNEGAHRVAVGRVTRITGLHNARTKAT